VTGFRPTRDSLLPDLTPQQEIAILARTLWREGYDDHLAGHITMRRPDGLLWCNPWLLTWEEFRPSDVIVIDLDGNLVEGDWPVPLGIPIHLALHKHRHDVGVAVHSHPRYGTVWADSARLPGMFDQSSALGGGTLVFVDEYEGAVNDVGIADRAVRAMGAADMAILANHGVFVTGVNVRAAHQRAVALEQRCRNAWHVEALWGGKELANDVQEKMLRSDGTGFLGFWEAAARAELRRDPSLLD
jgi:ribulose-5-phosphate 4-epimerase/fuculose-1-phosphate aldolase